MRRTGSVVVAAMLVLLAACGTDDADAGGTVARAERIAADLAGLVDDSAGIASTLRYGCSADPALQVAETNLTTSAAEAPREMATAMSGLLESEGLDSTLIDGVAGSGDIILRASDFELTVDVRFTDQATEITVTTDCLRSG